jgi:hypothetical protein
MQGAGWIELFRRIPENLHDSIALGLSTGNEMVVQNLLRLDEQFMVMRARVAGSNDGGRVVILPYGYIVSIAFNRKMSVDEVQEVFGESQFANAVWSNEDGAPPPEKPAAPANGAAAAPAPAAAAAATPAKPGTLSKSILLARLRERLADKAK